MSDCTDKPCAAYAGEAFVGSIIIFLLLLVGVIALFVCVAMFVVFICLTPFELCQDAMRRRRREV